MIGMAPLRYVKGEKPRTLPFIIGVINVVGKVIGKQSFRHKKFYF